MSATEASGWFGPFCAFLSSVTWAIGSSGYSKMSRDHSAFAVNFTRALIALPIFLAVVGVAYGVSAFSAVESGNVAWLAVSMIASYALGDVLFLWSTRNLGVPSALAIASIYPLWSALFGRMTGDGEMSWAQIGGLWMAVGGVITVILNAPRIASREGGGSERRTRRNGVLLAVATSFMWTLNTVAVARGSLGLSALTTNAVRMALALGLSAAMGSVLARGRPLVLPRELLRRYWWIFPIEAFGGSLSFTYGLAHSPLVLASVLSSLAPVLAVPVAWILRLEKPSLARTCGVLTVVVGLWLLIAAKQT